MGGIVQINSHQNRIEKNDVAPLAPRSDTAGIVFAASPKRCRQVTDDGEEADATDCHRGTEDGSFGSCEASGKAVTSKRQKSSPIASLKAKPVLHHRVSLNGEPSPEEDNHQFGYDDSSSVDHGSTAYLGSLSTPTMSTDDEDEADPPSQKVGATPQEHTDACVHSRAKVEQSAPCTPDRAKEAGQVNISQRTPCVSPGPPNEASEGKKLEEEHECSFMSLKHHIEAMRRESSQFPLKALLARLMTHTSNRKGLFNTPVDHVRLGLIDYPTIIPQPMDLGTVKSRLHAIAYADPSRFASDVRLTFANAMRYNPHPHPVHLAAKALLETFDSGFDSLIGACETEVGGYKPATVASSQPTMSPTQAIAPPQVFHAPPLGDGTPAAAFTVNQGGKQLGEKTVNGGASVATRNSSFAKLSAGSYPPNRQRGSSISRSGHSCETCLGDTCSLCSEGCLPLEPTLVVCSGSGCGQKIRKGSVYHCAPDATLFYCLKCYGNLPSILSTEFDVLGGSSGSVDVAKKSRCSLTRYKRDLIKRKYDEELAERWIACTSCKRRMHCVCAMYNSLHVDEKDFECPRCLREVHGTSCQRSVPPMEVEAEGPYRSSSSFVSGKLEPSQLDGGSSRPWMEWAASAADLPMCGIGDFIESKVRQRIAAMEDRCGTEATVTVRVISNVSRSFPISNVIQRHFRMGVDDNGSSVAVPSEVNYTSRTIMLFQKIDGVDVCIYCMYVHEYDDPLSDGTVKTSRDHPARGKRVYIAYLDSVDHFRPRELRTAVYQEVLVSYLASARLRGYQTAHIWACPPVRGNSFVFWAHPPQQRTPTRDRLLSWYHQAIARGTDTGTVTDVQSLYDVAFSQPSESTSQGVAICPPLLEGDYWMEQAVKIHRATISRHLKSQGSSGNLSVGCPSPEDMEPLFRKTPCPASQVSVLLQHRVIAHPKSVPFRRPVNAAALKLFDYHDVIARPMDLGTVQGRLLLGEYDTLAEVLGDIELVFDNATLYNPVGNLVHTLAIEVREIFFNELRKLGDYWDSCRVERASTPSETRRMGGHSARFHGYFDVSMRLGATVVEDNCLSATRLKQASSGPSFGCESEDASAVVPCASAMPTSSTVSTAVSVPATIPGAAHPTSPQQANCASLLSNTLSGSASAMKSPVRVAAKPKKGRRKSQQGTKRKKAVRNLCLFRDGAEAIAQRMEGDDEDPTEKKPKASKAKNGKRPSMTVNTMEGSSRSLKRESWLGCEVGTMIHKMRRDFFVCSLLPKDRSHRSDIEDEKLLEFGRYAEYDATVEASVGYTSSLADSRNGFLELSQYRHYQFDTLRRAKYSSSMLLYHFHNAHAGGFIPTCTQCNLAIKELRWHGTKGGAHRKELCQSCFSGTDDPDNYIPLRVSFTPRDKMVEL